MEEPDNNSADQTNKEKMDQWIKAHEDSLDYPDVPVGKRDYEFDESGLSPEVKKALAERETQLAKKTD